MFKRLICLKKVSEERDLSLDSDGFVGVPVPFSPSFLGIFILNQYYSDLSKNVSKDLPFVLKDLPSNDLTSDIVLTIDCIGGSKA